MITSLDMTHEQFIDLYILCGCDYTNTIDGSICIYIYINKKGIGYITAYKLIKE